MSNSTNNKRCGYMGSAFTLLLTLALLFGMVYSYHNIVDPVTKYGLIIVMLVLQIILQIRNFMRVPSDDKDSWGGISLIFTIIVIGIVVVGSLWIMKNLNENMMPSMKMTHTVTKTQAP